MSVALWWRRGWGALQILSTFAVLVTAAALGLSRLTAGVGAAIVVDGPPQGNFTRADSPYGLNRQRLRVALGQPLMFDSMWHTAKGGCERIVTSTLSQGDDAEAFILTQKRRGEFFAVGQPLRHPIKRILPMGIVPGLYRYRAEGVAICPTRSQPPVVYADFDVDLYDPDGPAVLPVGEPKITTPLVPLGGRLAYRISYDRLESLPSEILNTYTSIGPTPSGTPDIVIERRPTAGLGIGVHTDIDIATTLPPEVHAGRWRFRQVIVTERPGGKTRYDPQFAFEFEVAP